MLEEEQQKKKILLQLQQVVFIRFQTKEDYQEKRKVLKFQVECPF